MVKEDLDKWAEHHSATLETVAVNGREYILGAASKSCVAVFRRSGEDEYTPVCIARDKNGAKLCVCRREGVTMDELSVIKEDIANE